MMQMRIFSTMGAEQVQELLLSLIPTATLLLIGAFISQMISVEHTFLFYSFFLFGALLTFLGEKTVISFIRQARDNRYAELTTACRKFLAGNQKIKVVIRGKGELATLAETINLLLDQQRQLLQSNPPRPAQSIPTTPSSQPAPSMRTPQNDEARLLKEQLLRIINELAPITQGDLRVQIPKPNNLVGVIADACNSFIEELSQFVKWTRYASQVVTTASRSILDRSMEMAKNTENQMHLLSTTTSNIEEIASFMQHLSSNLHLNVEISKEVQRDIRAKIYPADIMSDTPTGHLLNELQRQTESLEGILHTAEETSTIAESLIGDIYAVAQQIYQSSVSALATVKRISELAALADRWYNVATTFTIFEDEGAKADSATWLL